MSAPKGTNSFPSRSSRVASELRGKISDGEWPVGSRLPTTRELARTHGVGLNTLRRALELLSEEGLVRSQQGSGVYVLAAPRRPAGALTIGLLVANHEFFSQAIDGVERMTRQAGARLLLACSENDIEREHTQFRELVAAGADGLILAPTRRPSQDVTEPDPLMDPPVPTVFIERTPRLWRRTHVSHVTSDLAGGVHSAVTHLVEHGRTRIGYLGWTSNEPGAEAYSGYVQAMADAGLPIIDGAVGLQPAAAPVHEYAAACKRLDLDGVFVLRETATIPLLSQLRRVGLRVPDDLAVMEFCDKFAAVVDVPLSGLNLRRDEIGRMAVQVLLRNIDLGDDAATCEVHYQPKMVLRQSCGGHGGPTASARDEMLVAPG